MKNVRTPQGGGFLTYTVDEDKEILWKLEVGRLTEKLNRYRIFLKTDTDTDFGI